MFEPELRLLQDWKSVLVATEDGYAVGRYHGEERPDSESYKVHLIDPFTDEVGPGSWYHKEDVYENTKENAEMLKR